MADLSKELNKELSKDFAYCEDTISRQAALDAMNEIINKFEQILRDIRESKVDDSVCGMCEYDGAYIGQSGDWCNECPGFDKDDCFKLSDECRKRWLKSVDLPSAQPNTKEHSQHVESVGCAGDTISRQAVKHLDLFTKTYCRDKSVEDDLVFRCKQCEFGMPDGKCLVKVMARKLCPDYREFGCMGDL